MNHLSPRATRQRGDDRSQAYFELGDLGGGGLPKKCVLVGGGEPLGYRFDEGASALELAHDIDRTFDAQAALLARMVRDVVAASLGRPRDAVTLRPRLTLDRASGMATPQWCIGFDGVGVTATTMATLEASVRMLCDLAGDASSAIWNETDLAFAPQTAAAAAIVEAARDLRAVAGDKSLSSHCRISCADFAHEIDAPARIGSKPPINEHHATTNETGELVGFDRTRRLLHFLEAGYHASIDIHFDAAVFSDVVHDQAPKPGNVCRLWYRADRQPGKPTRYVLLKLQVLQGELFDETSKYYGAEIEVLSCD